MAEIEIQNAKTEDLDLIAEIEKICWDKLAASRDDLKRRIELFPQGFFAAYINGEIVGIANSAIFEEREIETVHDIKPFEKYHNPNGRILYFYSACTLPEYRKKGVLKSFFRAMEELAKKLPNIEKLWVLGSDAERFGGPATTPIYERYGFIVVKKLPHFLPSYPTTLFEKTIL